MKSMIKKFLLLVAMVGMASGLYGKAIHTAVRKGDLEKIKKILKKHPERVNQKSGKLIPGATLRWRTTEVTPLAVAYYFKQKEAARLLLSKGADINISEVALYLLGSVEDRLKVLNAAIVQRKVWWAKLFIEAGGSLKPLMKQRDVLRSVGLGGKNDPKAITAVELLFRGTLFNTEILQAMVKAQPVELFKQPVFKFVFNLRNFKTRLAAFKVLIQGDVRKKFARDFTLLHLTAARGDIQLASYLIENGAGDDLKAKTTGNQMPIHLATDLGMRAYLENEMRKRNIPVE